MRVRLVSGQGPSSVTRELRWRIEAAGKWDTLIAVCRAHRVTPETLLTKGGTPLLGWMHALRFLQCSDNEIARLSGRHRKTVARMLSCGEPVDSAHLSR